MGFFGLIFAKIIILSLVLILLVQVDGEPWEDKQALIDFVRNTSRSRYLNWSPFSPVCTTWTGVTCNDNQTRVVALRLPGFGFQGPVPDNTIGRLTGLQTLSLRNNMFSGPFPSDLYRLRNLTSLYLQFNKFFGPLPLDFSVWSNLVVLNLSNNEFNGSISKSISDLSRVTTLDLSSNSLTGQVPDIGGNPGLKYLNLSNNHLNGSLPRSLSRFPSSAFDGNDVSPSPAVSIPPLPSPMGPTSQPVQPRGSKKLSETALLGIILGGCAVVFVVVAVLIIVFYLNKENSRERGVVENITGSKKKRGVKESPEEKFGKITFFEGSNFAFDLEDLLRASAEVLGKGTFGTTYKAALEDSTVVVVKRLKEVSVGKREFEQQMEVVGRIKHDNVVALRAYYYSKEEKLMVYDYFSAGNLSTMLHGKRGENPTAPLNWETRLKIVVGAARGLAHIHTQNNGKLVHGNIKSSNIFINPQNYGSISDLGLATIITPVTPPAINRIIGYRAPELTDPRKSTQASDVYSFGVLVLELLTGKNPLGEGVSLVRWVNSVVREEWTAEVFDLELLKYPNVEEEMVSMLQLGIACAERVPDRRPKMDEVVRLAEDLRRGYSSTRPSSEVSTPTPPPGSASHVVEMGSTSTSAPQ